MCPSPGMVVSAHSPIDHKEHSSSHFTDEKAEGRELFQGHAAQGTE